MPQIPCDICTNLYNRKVLKRPISSIGGCWFDTDALPIMQEARRARLAAVKTGFDMGSPFNELNRIFALGFKPLPWGDTGYLKSNLNPIGATGSDTIALAAPKHPSEGASPSS